MPTPVTPTLKTLAAAVYRAARRIARARPRTTATAGAEKSPDYYRLAFDANEERRQHYTASPYYPLWTVIVDRLRRARVETVLEVGCGSGQLAWAIDDAHILTGYCGFDFTDRMIHQARLNCPHLSFEIADAYTTRLFETFPYDTVIATEFLEHVEHDIRVLRTVRPGARFIGTVPNFPYVSHLRHFRNPVEVAARYADLFTAFSVDALPANDRGKTFFLIEAIKREA